MRGRVREARLGTATVFGKYSFLFFLGQNRPCRVLGAGEVVAAHDAGERQSITQTSHDKYSK